MLIVVSDPKSSRAWQREIPREREVLLYGRKIGELIDGDIVGLRGYRLKISGGSDKDGFPMRAEIEGSGRVRILISRGVGIRGAKRGERRRKLVRGNTVSGEIVQLNVVIVGRGEQSLEELGFV